MHSLKCQSGKDPVKIIDLIDEIEFRTVRPCRVEWTGTVQYLESFKRNASISILIFQEVSKWTIELLNADFLGVVLELVQIGPTN